MHFAFPILFGDVMELVLGVCIYVAAAALPLALLGYAAYHLLSLPLRRQERARFFLHLLENCLRQGRPIEATLADIANCRDRSPGVLFHLVAAHIEEGDRLADALREVPRLLPAPVTAMLQAGAELGDLGAVLPACRVQLRDARSNLSSALNYFLVLALGLAPIALFMFWSILVFILPKFREIMEGMFHAGQSGWLSFLAASLYRGLWVETTFLLLFFLAGIFYAAGPTLSAKLRLRSFAFVDWLAWRVPWKRKRMQRNFGAMLAILLDHGVPEAAAVRLAADCAANEIFRRRAARVGERLAQGQSLTEAVHALDDAGEFRWRLTNAVHAHGGFVRALRGWLEALDARAFQQEQAAAHVLSTTLVVVNGVVVGCVCAGVFGLLSQFIEVGTLW
jgi:type II secretory pathway component PulF